MKIKKIFALLLALAMVFSLAACSNSNDDLQSSTPGTEQSSTPSDPGTQGGETSDLNVGVFWYAYSDAFLSTVRTALDAELSAAGKPELVYFNANNSDKYQLDPNGAWSSTAAFDFMSTNLAEYSEANGNMIELIIANNDDMADAVSNAAGSAEMYSVAEGFTTKLFVAYAPFTA